MILLFERPCWWRTLLCWKEIRACDAIQFFQFRDISSSEFPEPPGKAVRAFLKRLNPRIRLNPLNEEQYLSLWLENNLVSDSEVKKVFEPMRGSPSFKQLEKDIDEKGLERYYQMRLLAGVLAQTLYLRIAEHLSRETTVRLVPVELPDSPWRASVPRGVQWMLQVNRKSRQFLRFVTLSNPLKTAAYCTQSLFRILFGGGFTLTCPKPQEAEVIAPIIYGFAQGPFKGAGHGDVFLLDSNLTPDRVLFYFSSWKFGPQEKQKQIACMQQLGIRYVDPGHFRADPAFLREAAWFCLRLMARLFTPRGLMEDPRSVQAAGAFARHYLEELLFAHRVRFKVSVEFQDYSPAHVVRTLLANRYGGATVAMHHGAPAAPWVLPHLRYTFVNRHCVWGEAFLRLHEGHWDRSNCIPVGCYRLDDVQTAQNADRQQALTENYAERFGGRRPLILLLFPSLSWYTLRSRVRELLEGLKLLQQLPGPFQIVCRFRDAHQRQQWMEVGLAELFNTDPRITEDVSSFSTAEWMALSDLIISNSHSTGIIEAAGSHKPCVAFDYMTTAEKVFSRYSSTVAIKSREELVDLVKKAQAGHLPSLAGGAWLAKDYSFYSDGQNTNRFRGAVTELMKSPFVLALSRDPGGAEVLEPVVEALRNQERFRIHHLHLKTRQSFSAWRREARRRLQESRPDFLLTATSHGSGMEKAFIREAALRGIPCLTVLDSWSNYRSRFLEPGETLASHRLPSVIGVMDDFAVQEMEQLGFPKDRLRIVGQPGFDRFLEWARKSSTQSLRSQFRSEHGIGPDEKLVVFFSQPIRQMDGPPGSASYRGYREEEALQLLMRCLSERKGRTPFRLLVKLHPKEKSGKYDKLFRNASIPVQLFDSGHANALLLASDIAVGMTSTMLIKAALLNRPVLSIQPNQQGEERLMLSRRQFLRSCRDESAVRETLETAWMTEPQQGRFSSFSSVVGDGRSTQRIVDQIQSLLKNRAPKREPRTVLIESAALLPIFSGWKQLRQAERILFFCAHHLAEEKRAPFRRRLAERLLHRLNSRADIRDLSEELTADLGYSNNLESDRYVEQVFQKIQKTASYKLVFQQINDPHADRFYKMRVLPRVLRVTQFLRTAEYLKKYSVDLTVLPSTLYEESLRVPPILRAYLKCQKLCRRFLRVLTFYNVWAIVGAGPLFLFQQGWRAGIRRSFKPVQADVIHPIVYGTQEDGLFQGIRTGIDDDWVLNGALDSSRLAFYFSDWKFSPDEERVQRERLKQRGIECFHPARLPLTFRTLREQLALSFQMGWEILRYPRILSEEGWIARISASLFYQYLRELHFCQSVEYKISVEQQDHSAAHVIRTIVANRFGRLTVGMHHGVPEGPYGLPMLRYVHINRYGVWGRAFQQSYAGFWESTQTVPIGDFRLDWIIAAQQPERLRQLETRYQTQFGGIRPLVVVLFPTLGEYHLRTRLTEFLEGLRLLKTLPGAFQVVCRFRSQALAQDYLRLGLDAILQADSRILIDLTEFTTPEWMALADVVIANSISTGLLEAASCGKVCFTFDTMRLAERVYSPYGKNLVLKDRHEFVRVVQNASGSFEGWECRWSQLAQDYNYFSDGRNIERFQNLLLQTLDPEKHPAVPMQPEAVLSGAAV